MNTFYAYVNIHDRWLRGGGDRGRSELRRNLERRS